MPNDFQAALADMIDANTTMVDALAKVAAMTSLSAETVKQIVNGEGGAPDEVAAVAAALKVKPGGTRTKAKKTEPMAGGKSVTVTVEGFAEHTTKPFTIFTADPEPGPRKYTVDDLQVIADNFNGRIKRLRNEDLKNPLVIGHEEDQQILKRSDLPAAGWISRVDVEGNRLVGVADRVPDTVRSWIDSGAYQTWSAEIYRDYHGLGPALRRVALLGADIPHKKDLGELAWENNHDDEPYDTLTGATMDVDKFADNLAALIRSKITSMTSGENAEKSRADLIKEISSKAGIEEGTVNDIVSGRIEAPPANRLRAIASVLNIGVSTLQNTSGPKAAKAKDMAVDKNMEQPMQDLNNNGIDDGEEIEIKGKMKKSQAAAPAPAAAAPAPMAPQPPRPPQRFAEEDMQTINDLKEMLAIERKRRLDIEAAQRVSTITKFAEDKAKEGYWTGDTTTKIIDGLKKLEGVDKFDEGESATDVAMRLLADVAPKQQRSNAPLSALAVAGSQDEEADLSALKTDFAEYCKLGGTLSLEKYAENNGFDLPESK